MKNQQPVLASSSLASTAIMPHLTPGTQATLAALIADLPEEKRGRLRVTVDLDRLGADVALKLHEHVKAAAFAGRKWSGEVVAGGGLVVEWEP